MSTLFSQIKTFLFFLLLLSGCTAIATGFNIRTFLNAHRISKEMLQLIHLFSVEPGAISKEMGLEMKQLSKVSQAIRDITENKNSNSNPTIEKDKNTEQKERLRIYLNTNQSINGYNDHEIEKYTGHISQISRKVFEHLLYKKTPGYYKLPLDSQLKNIIENLGDSTKTIFGSTGYLDRLEYAKKIIAISNEIKVDQLAASEQTILTDLNTLGPTSTLASLESCRRCLEGPFDCNWEVKTLNGREEAQASSPLGVGEESWPFEPSIMDYPRTTDSDINPAG